MARKRLLTNSISVNINLDGMEYALKSLPLDGQLKKQINQLLVDYCDPYIPFRTGNLANFYKVTANSVTYEMPYARYQYYGKVYGPNDFKGYNADGTPRFRTPAGTEKYPTGAYLMYSTEFHPLATSEWDKAMMEDVGDEFTAAVADIVIPTIRRKQRIASARAMNL